MEKKRGYTEQQTLALARLLEHKCSKHRANKRLLIFNLVSLARLRSWRGRRGRGLTPIRYAAWITARIEGGIPKHIRKAFNALIADRERWNIRTANQFF